MGATKLPKHFVLDHNFPIHATGLSWPSSLRVSNLASIDSSLVKNKEDWEVLLALSRRGDVDGFITNDSAMLRLATEMVALTRTTLTLVVVEGAGHNPVRALGLVMAHLETIAGRLSQSSQIIRLKPIQWKPESPHGLVANIARQTGSPMGDILNAELSRMGLSR
jgi:hypothetical protein